MAAGNKNMKHEEMNGNPNSSRYDLGEDIAEVLKNSRMNLNSEDLDDEAFTTPFEILAEFLSAVMARDYKSALHYCELILEYEPNNVTVQEFHPLIEEKIRLETCSSEESADGSDNSRESTDGSTEYYSSVSSADSSTGHSSSSSADEDDCEECPTCIVVNGNVSDSILSGTGSSSGNEHKTDNEREHN